MAVSATAVWLTRPRGIQWRPVLDTVRQQFPQTTLWRRQMVKAWVCANISRRSARMASVPWWSGFAPTLVVPHSPQPLREAVLLPVFISLSALFDVIAYCADSRRD